MKLKVWRKLSDHARNEALDLSVYNLAIAHKLRLHTFSHADWERLRKKLIPRTPTLDLFNQPAQAPAASLALVGGTSSEGETTAPDVVPVAPITPAESAAPTSAALQIPAHHQPAPKGRRIYSKGLTA